MKTEYAKSRADMQYSLPSNKLGTLTARTVAGQAEQIEKLTEALHETKDIAEELRKEVEALRIVQVDLTARLNGARGLINDNLFAGHDPVDEQLYVPTWVPKYQKDEITPFYVGPATPARLIRMVKAKPLVPSSLISLVSDFSRYDLRAFSKHSIFLVGHESMWGEKFNNFTLVRADSHRDADGKWTARSHRKLKQANHIVALLNGRAFYVGAYKSVYIKRLSPDLFQGFPKEVRRTIVNRVDRNETTRAESEAMLHDGRMSTTRLTMRRVGYDHKFQAALLKVSAQDKSYVNKQE